MTPQRNNRRIAGGELANLLDQRIVGRVDIATDIRGDHFTNRLDIPAVETVEAAVGVHDAATGRGEDDIIVTQVAPFIQDGGGQQLDTWLNPNLLQVSFKEREGARAGHPIGRAIPGDGQPLAILRKDTIITTGPAFAFDQGNGGGRVKLGRLVLLEQVLHFGIVGQQGRVVREDKRGRRATRVET